METEGKTPELSVIVPIYKVEKYLKECIDSILNQTFTDFELILVDDGSPDNCPEICDEYAKQDSRIQVIHQKNGGLSAARNAGIEIARGKWLGFIDSDDFVAPDFYEKLFAAAKASDADCAMCSVQWTAENGDNISVPDMLKVKSGVWKGREVLDTIKSRLNYSFSVATNKIYRREIFDTIRYPVGRLNEDTFIFAELFNTVNKMVCIEEPMYYYRQHGNSIMHVARTSRNLDESWAFYHWFQYFEQRNMTDLLDATERQIFGKLTNVYYELPRDAQRSEEAKAARKMQRDAVKKLAHYHLLSGRTLFRTVLFQAFPDIYGNWKKSKAEKMKNFHGGGG